MKHRILYVGMKYDYGNRSRGISYEHRNFYSSFIRYCEKNDWDFDFFDFMDFGQSYGTDSMSEELIRQCEKNRPTILFSVLYHFDNDPHYEVFKDISQRLGIITCNWFCDDQWRFESYSSTVAPYFDYSCTTSQTAVPKYVAAGLASRVIKTQWACNDDLYKPSAQITNVDVSFIGQPHGNRPELVEKLNALGVPVELYGFGWPNRPRVPFHQMVRLFTRSRINLNLSKASNFQEEQIKGRNFEIPGALGFQLSFDADNLGDYYEDGKEIVLVRSIEEMADKAKYFLSHEDQRRAIAYAGYQRTLTDHRWENRFDEIFGKIGAPRPAAFDYSIDEESIQFKNQRIDEQVRVNKELWEARTYLSSKNEYLEEEIIKKQNTIKGVFEENSKLYAKINELNELATEQEIEFNQLKYEKSALDQSYEDLSVHVSHLNNRIAILEETLRGMNNLKMFRLRDAIRHDPISFKKIMRIFYLLLGICLPRVVREKLRPVTISLKRNFGFLPHTEAKVKKIKQTPWPSDRPLLTVVMPSFNYGRFIREAIDSVLQQTFQNFEILIIDCSTDKDTIDYLKSLHHPKIKVIFREGRHLLGDNRNFGIIAAKGKYVTCLDPDDKLKPTYYEKALYILEQGKFDIVSPSVQEFDQGSVRWLLHVRPQLSHLIEMNLLSVVAVYNKEVWKRSKGFHDYGMEAEHVHEDWDFWIRSMALGARVMNIREQLMWYRIHGTNMSKSKKLPTLDEQRKQILEFNKNIVTPASVRRSDEINRTRYIVEDGLVNLLSGVASSPAQKTILFALPYAVVGGAHKRFLELALYLKQNGYKIVVVTTLGTSDHQINLLSEYEAVTQDIFPLSEVLADQMDWKEFVFYLIQTRNVGSIFLGGSQFFYDILAEVKSKYPNIKVVDQQFNLFVHFDNNRSNCSRIDHTIVENESIAERIKELDPEGKVKFDLIHNGVDTQGEFAPGRAHTERPPIIPPTAIVVSFIGRISVEKAPDIFVELAKKLSKDKNLFFIMAGPGPLYDEMLDKVKRLGLEDRVWMPGSVNTKEFLSFTDILVVPSRIDGRPNIILEALSLGVPVVASDIGGIPFLVKDGETGFLCPREDVEMLCEKVKILSRERELRTKMGRYAREFAVNNLDCSIFLPKYLEVLNRLYSSTYH